jgi:hypothetical protein
MAVFTNIRRTVHGHPIPTLLLLVVIGLSREILSAESVNRQSRKFADLNKSSY